MKQNYKKSILGLNTVKAFIVVLLSLAIIAIITLVVLGSFEGIVTTPLQTTFFTNTSTVYKMNSTATPFVISTNRNCQATLSSVVNSTGAVSCAGNYTLSGCSVTSSGLVGNCNNTVWYLNGYYTDTAPIGYITNNVSNGIIAFFSNSATYFALLGVVVIILIISLVVVVVNRFGGGVSGNNEPSL